MIHGPINIRFTKNQNTRLEIHDLINTICLEKTENFRGFKRILFCCAPCSVILPSTPRSPKWYLFLFRLRRYIKVSSLTSVLVASPIESSRSFRRQLLSKMRSTNFNSQNVLFSFVAYTFLPSQCTQSSQTLVTKHLQFVSGPQHETVFPNYVKNR